jgi:hypothetical protein
MARPQRILPNLLTAHRNIMMLEAIIRPLVSKFNKTKGYTVSYKSVARLHYIMDEFHLSAILSRPRRQVIHSDPHNKLAHLPVSPSTAKRFMSAISFVNDELARLSK